MHINYGITAVEFVEYRGKGRIGDPLVPVTGEQADTVGFQNIERVRDLIKAAIGTGQRQRRKRTKATRIVVADLCCIFVASARQAPALRHVAEPNAGVGHRANRRLDPVAIHFLNGAFRRPFACLLDDEGRKGLRNDVFVDPGRGYVMVVDVDTIRFALTEHAARQKRT